jgi:hypothetical protein
MPIGDQDHRGVTMSVPIIAGGFDQPLNLAIGEVFPASECGVRYWGASQPSSNSASS